MTLYHKRKICQYNRLIKKKHNNASFKLFGCKLFFSLQKRTNYLQVFVVLLPQFEQLLVVLPPQDLVGCGADDFSPVVQFEQPFVF